MNDELYRLKCTLDGLGYIELKKIKRYCSLIEDKAKYEDLKEIFFNHTDSKFRRVFVNIGRGQSVKWQEFELVGLEDNQVIVKDPRNSKSRKRTVKLDSITTKEDFKRDEKVSGYALNLETGIYEKYSKDEKDKYEFIELEHHEVQKDVQLFGLNM